MVHHFSIKMRRKIGQKKFKFCFDKKIQHIVKNNLNTAYSAQLQYIARHFKAFTIFLILC